MAEKLSKHLSKLSKRGPHRVLVGSLDYAGLPGKIYTPSTGNGIPAIAFGHDWLKDISKYHATLRHFASWGIAVAAPNTERTLSPNHRGFAADLESCLQILASVKLGTGQVVVSPQRLGLVGHGMGASAAVLAAASRPGLKGVAALYPSQSTPPATTAATAITAPGLVLGMDENPIFDYGNPAEIAAQWGGICAYREIEGATHHSLTEDTLFNMLTGAGRTKAKHHELIRGLVTGFLLATLGDEKKYSAFAQRDAVAKKVVSFSGSELAEKATQLSTQKIPGLSK
ncbi:Abhydrolase domain-containing protein 5 [Corynebacterium kutscheri]|uniref:poly(ethylene terephthalate) hydrolase family protein n=1 Tax=Corynebacterium kutscheri TaxID=35755 RepID=UPI000F71A263|nr:dienelactone hydrolase family protein [Corynebacterium kutscheri]VEH80504.1 Abhydrolase domain-containing protein 5 [Corynebacterium kutscheri]